MTTLSAAPLAGARLLVVDDEEAIRVLLAETLRDAGAEVLCVEDGRMAVAVLDTYCPDGILLDLMMPRQDGIQTVSIIRGTCRRSGMAMPRLMIITAGYRAVDVARSLGIGHWLGKPFTLTELLESTMALLADSPPPVEEPVEEPA